MMTSQSAYAEVKVSARPSGAAEAVRGGGHAQTAAATNLGRAMEGVGTFKASYVTPRGPGLREKGIRGELLERFVTQKISEKVHADFYPAAPETEFCSTTRRDFSFGGFIPAAPRATKHHDYRRDEAISFWSENHCEVQGISAVRTPDTPFRRTTLFSTPVALQLNDATPPPEN